MKKLFPMLVMCLTVLFVKAQPATLDPTYVTGTGFNNYVFKTDLQSDGKLIAVGAFTNFNGTARNNIVRLNTNGTLDMAFTIGTGFDSWVNDVKIQPDGKILAVGSFTSFNGTSRNGIVRLNSDGTLDTSFDPGTGFVGATRGLDLQADGKVLVVGDFTSFNGTTRNKIARLNTNGSLDTGYDPGTGFNGNAQTVKIQPDGKALVGGRNSGSFTSYNGTPSEKIIRLNSDATVDTGFNVGTGCNAGIADFDIQADSKIIVGGLFTTYNGTIVNRIMRLNSDGSIDLSFNTGTGATFDVRNVEIASDGSIFAVGLFTSFNGATANHIVKLNPNGSTDVNFATGTGFNGEVNAISIQNDNKVILSGFYSSYNGTFSGVSMIARLNNCFNTTAIDYQTSCGDFTWIDGNTYTSNNNTATHIMPNSTGCDSIITLNLLITTIADESVNAAIPTFCDMGSTTISTTSSQNGVLYYLRDDSDDSVIDGPIEGTGSGLDFSTPSITTTTTYNVYAERVENGLEFDGIDDKAQVNGVDLAGNSFTIEFWGRRNSISGDDFFIGQGTTTNNHGLHIGFRPSNLFTFAFFGNDVNTPVYTDLDWHHWAVTYNANNNARRIYRDGILVASDVASSDYLGTGDIVFGDLTWGGATINGNIDEVRIWNSDKTMLEIQSLMNTCLVGDETGLLAYYTLDEVAGTSTVTDNTSNGFDGVLVNMDVNTAWQAGYANCTCTAEMTDLVTITINNSNTGTDIQEHCASYTWIDGNTYTANNNTATHTLTNTVGCDSVVTLNLTIHQPDATTDVQSACDSYTWIDGNTYTANNNSATFTLSNMAGCDSVVALNLTITASPIASAVNNGDGTLSATGAGTYQWIDCGTNTAVPGATSSTFVPTANGNYAVVVTSGSCDDTSACVNYNSVGLAENGKSVFTAYPNPTTGYITINSNNAIIAKVVVRDAAGRIIIENSNTSASSSVDLTEMENGIYFITIFDTNQTQTTMKVMKQ